MLFSSPTRGVPYSLRDTTAGGRVPFTSICADHARTSHAPPDTKLYLLASVCIAAIDNAIPAISVVCSGLGHRAQMQTTERVDMNTCIFCSMTPTTSGHLPFLFLVPDLALTLASKTSFSPRTFCTHPRPVCRAPMIWSTYDLESLKRCGKTRETRISELPWG
ncbi:hypothetical protein B0H16DRAFT_586031 [Mycena metata]|uniref:Uncharacterized protein n=1 Tax=Mycena metata TaxID=1033252 RepID=A0AAD7J9I0_9AGAR|nr:hypothetical protein B0H16DRAFT_586031 [Mycena metata]